DCVAGPLQVPMLGVVAVISTVTNSKRCSGLMEFTVTVPLVEAVPAVQMITLDGLALVDSPLACVARSAPVTVNPSGRVTRSELGFDTEPTGELFVTFAWKTTLVLAATAVVGLVIANAIVLWLGAANPGMAVATSRAAIARPPIQRPFFETRRFAIGSLLGTWTYVWPHAWGGWLSH